MNNTGKSKVECRSLRLSEAISDGRLYQTKVILEDNFSLNYIDQEGLSPLMRAFLIEDEKHRTRTAMVKLLLQQQQIDVNLRDKEERTVLLWACKMNKLDLVKILFTNCLQDMDLSAQDKFGNTSLMYAAQNNNVGMVTVLVNAMRKFSLSVDQRNIADKTAYYKAIELGHEECARILTDVGRASRDIKVNPFLEVLGIDDPECSAEVRVTCAAAGKDCVVQHDVMVARRKKKGAKAGEGASGRKTPSASTNFASKKRRSRLIRPGNINCEDPTIKQRENTPKSRQRANGDVLWRAGERNSIKSGMLNESFVEMKADQARPASNGNYVYNSPRRQKPGVQDHFLRVILDETHSIDGILNGRRSRSPMSSICSNLSPRSVSPITNNNKQINIAQIHQRGAIMSGNNFLKPPQHTKSKRNKKVGVLYTTLERNASVSEYKSTGSDPYHMSDLGWTASIEQPPNTLRNLLALRAEQQSEGSSYRRGLVIPKYVPPPEKSTEERSGTDVLSSISENSGRSDAGRRLFNVAKKIGLSLYLSNKRKGLNKEDS